MTSGIRKLFRRLDAKRRALLRGYDVEALHQLRVTLRRIRSLLKKNDSRPAHLRHDLGELADSTNDARDWDTLAIRARETLDPQQFRLVQPWLEERHAASRRSVLDMLRSDQCLAVMRDLKKFVRDKGKAPGSDTCSTTHLSLAKQDVYLAWCKVQSVDDNKSWHKLRLAIKELRYSLQNVPKDSRDISMFNMLQQCKRLQENLGIWHDTIVHLRMVREIASNLDLQAERAELDVLNAWCQQMEHDAQNYLDRCRSTPVCAAVEIPHPP